MRKNNGYTMYVGDGKMTQTNDPNTCRVIRLDNPEGTENAYWDFMAEGFDFPETSIFDKEEYPLIFVADEYQDWLRIDPYELAPSFETAVKVFRKFGKKD